MKERPVDGFLHSSGPFYLLAPFHLLYLLYLRRLNTLFFTHVDITLGFFIQNTVILKDEEVVAMTVVKQNSCS